MAKTADANLEAERGGEATPGDAEASPPRSRATPKSIARRRPAPPRPAEAEAGAPDPDLRDLAARIGEAHRLGAAAARTALEHARVAGGLLAEAKARLGHGRFQEWVEAHCGFGYRAAANYMKVHRGWPEVERLRDENVHRDAPLTLSGTLRAIARPRAVRPIVVEASAAIDPRGEADRTEIAPGRCLPAPSGVGAVPADRRGCEEVGDRGFEARAGVATTRGPGGGDGSTPPPVVELGPAVAALDEALGRLDLPIDDEFDRSHGAEFGTIWDVVRRAGNAERFLADATMWVALRRLADELPSDGPRYLALVQAPHSCAALDLAKAPSPSEWMACDHCGGAGKAPPGVARGGLGMWPPEDDGCGPCNGTGYLFYG